MVKFLDLYGLVWMANGMNYFTLEFEGPNVFVFDEGETIYTVIVFYSKNLFKEIHFQSLRNQKKTKEMAPIDDGPKANCSVGWQQKGA